MATPKKNDKPEEKFIKDGEGLTGTDSAASDAANAGTDTTAGDTTNAGTVATAGDADNAGTNATAGDVANAGTETTAGDGTDTSTGSGQKAMLDFIRSSLSEKTDASTDVKPSWFTVQVVRSPSGKRFRAGIEFTSEPKPFDFSLFNDEQLEKLAADPFLRIKPYTPAEE